MEITLGRCRSWTLGPTAAASRAKPLPTLAGNVAQFCGANGYLLNIEIKPTPGTERETGEVVRARLHGCGKALVPPLLTSFQPEALMGAQNGTGAACVACCWIRCGPAGWNAR